MSAAGDRLIVCRRCSETISRDVGSCPHCGAEIRGRRLATVALIIGVVVILAGFLNFEELWPYILLGAIIAFGGGYFIYDQWRRIRDAEPVASEPPDVS